MPLGDAMTHWQETARIHETLARLADAGRSAALATVVRIRGSAYRRPGAKMLIADDGVMAGSVSGGCLEADVRDPPLAGSSCFGVCSGSPPGGMSSSPGGVRHLNG